MAIRIIAWIMCGVAGVATGQGIVGLITSDPAPAEDEIIEGDDPRWDCRTMGNRTCGVPGPGGEIFLVHHDDNGEPVLVTPSNL